MGQNATMSAKPTIPSYCQHKAKGQAYVRLNGEFIYLGKYGSPESKAAYQRLIAEWLARGCAPRPVAAGPDGLSVNEVLLAYWRHAQEYYGLPDAPHHGELSNVRLAILPVKALYGMTPADQFGPLALKAVRTQMVEHALCRNTVNQRVAVIKRVFRWAVSEELVSPMVIHGLDSVDGLKLGHTTAREAEPIKPVDDQYVQAVLPFLTPTVRAMVEVQMLTGMRSGEICRIRTCDIDMSGKVWFYRPDKHKTAHRGHVRAVPLGPRAQEIVPSATAILDRFLHHAEIITITGRSYRLKDHAATEPTPKPRSARQPAEPKAAEQEACQD